MKETGGTWIEALGHGFLQYAEPYCGSCTNMTDRGFGLGGNVVLHMTENVHMQPSLHAVFDNFLGQLKNMNPRKY